MIFRQPNAAVTAHMKAHLASSTSDATALNNGRKVLEDNAGSVNLVYMDGSEIWYCNSTDNGNTWSNEKRVSVAANNNYPSIAYFTGAPKYGVAWDRQQSGNHFPVLRYKVSLAAGWSDEIFADPEDNIYTPENCKPALIHAKPANILSNLGYWMLCRVDNGNDKIGIGLLRGGVLAEEVSEEQLDWIGLLPGSDAKGDNPSIAAENSSARVIHFAWQEEDHIYYSNYDGESFLDPPEEVTAGFTDIGSHALPSISARPNNEINLVWQAIQQGGGVEKMETMPDGERIECPPASQNNPAVCFRQRASGSWGALQVFLTNNTCDRNPVFTSWQVLERENYAIAYESAQGRIDYLLKLDGRDWTSPAIMTNDGDNPAITTINGSPNVFWTEYSEAPYRIQHADELLSPLEMTENPPHSRRVYFNLNKAFPNIKLNADMILQISDPLFFDNGEPKIIKPQYRDSLLKGDNAFIFQSVGITNHNSRLQIPIQVTAMNIRIFPNGNRSVKPFLRLNVKNANNNQLLNTIYTYKTDTLVGDTLILQDTFNVDLSTYLNKTIRLEGEMFFEKNSAVQIAEVYDLRQPPAQQFHVTSTAEPALATTPKQFILAQNYPNPFNPETVIEFALPAATTVRLDIFDITGRQIKTLTNKLLEAGVHQVIWDGRDESGSQAASGVYFYRIQAGQFTAINKMMLLK